MIGANDLPFEKKYEYHILLIELKKRMKFIIHISQMPVVLAF